MKKSIGRVAFFFKDGDEQMLILNDKYFPISTLLTRLLNERYKGPAIKFINIHFSTEKTYSLHPISVKNATHYYGGHLNYRDVFDLSIFNNMTKDEQISFIWNISHRILCRAAKTINNVELLNAANYAHKKGIEIGLTPNLDRSYVLVNFNSDFLNEVTGILCKFIEVPFVVYFDFFHISKELDIIVD